MKSENTAYQHLSDDPTGYFKELTFDDLYQDDGTSSVMNAGLSMNDS